ncbi:MAG: AraC family transcriptional regulator, partial [Streptosporangiaceae bacterium]|nr:AraC family transcriptional regulator [Streptosporangiaceae bacterium]
GPRHFLLLDTSLPFGGWRGEDGETVELIIVTFARKLLPLPRKVVGQLLGKRFSGRDGMGLLIWDFIERAVRDCEHYQPSDRTRLANSIVDLVAALIAHELEADEVVPSHSRHNALVLRIKDFIRARLGDPDLSPDTIAAAHYISTRQLHKLFSAEDETVAAWTRACRLEACRRDLADSMWRDEPVHVIAARRGFSSAAHFSRSFREKYGMTPKEYRQQALAGQLPHANVSDGRLVCRTAPSAGSQISLDEAG